MEITGETSQCLLHRLPSPHCLLVLPYILYGSTLCPWLSSCLGDSWRWFMPWVWQCCLFLPCVWEPILASSTLTQGTLQHLQCSLVLRSLCSSTTRCCSSADGNQEVLSPTKLHSPHKLTFKKSSCSLIVLLLPVTANSTNNTVLIDILLGITEPEKSAKRRVGKIRPTFCCDWQYKVRRALDLISCFLPGRQWEGTVFIFYLAAMMLNFVAIHSFVLLNSVCSFARSVAQGHQPNKCASDWNLYVNHSFIWNL